MASFEDRAGLWHAATLCLIAGFVDAFGYFELGHVFTANMTGNTVLLGAALVKGDWLALSYIATIGAFSLGVVAATLLKMARVPLPAILLIAGALLLLVSAITSVAFVMLCVLAFVMGLQGGAISTFSGIRLPTVVVTSTLVNLIDGIMRRSLDQAHAPAPSAVHIRHLFAAWVAYGLGGAAAVIMHAHLPVPLAVPAVLYAGVAAALIWR